MTYPNAKVPAIATDAVFASGPDTGLPTRVAVSLGQQAQGAIGGQPYPAQAYNWIQGLITDHLRNISEIPLRSWDRVPTDTLGASNSDKFFGIFAYAKGAERVGHLQILGANSAQTAHKLYYNGAISSWRGATISSGGGALYEMAANADGSVVIAVGTTTTNQIQRSTDGANYTLVSAATAHNYTSCCFSNGKFFAMTSSSPYKIGKSSDGSTWAVTATDPGLTWTGALIRAGKSGGLPAVLVCNGVNVAVTTNEGASWSTGTIGAVGAFAVSDIRYSNGLGLWMAVTNDFAVAVSSDGVNWTTVRAASMVATGSSGIYNLANDDGGAWVVSGNQSGSPEAPGPFVAYSVDGGLTWTGVRLDEGDSECHVCWHPAEQRFYAVCDLIAGTSPTLVFRTPSFGQGGGLVV